MRVAALDDDTDHLDLTKCTLKAMNYQCHTFTEGAALMNELRRESFDLLLLDWMLPDVSGPEIVRWVRRNVKESLPILFVTNQRAERDVVEGLGVGADDFMSKPVRVAELTARIQALLRRSHGKTQAKEEAWGRYRFIPAAGRLEIDGKLVQLTRREFELALFLFQNLGRKISRGHMLESIWKTNPGGTELMSRSLDTHISRVRTVLGLRPENGYSLSAVYGQGYLLEAIQDAKTEATAMAPQICLNQTCNLRIAEAPHMACAFIKTPSPLEPITVDVAGRKASEAPGLMREQVQ